jgi:formiminotetrahydrofolate cyclodeaminase
MYPLIFEKGFKYAAIDDNNAVVSFENEINNSKFNIPVNIIPISGKVFTKNSENGLWYLK